MCSMQIAKEKLIDPTGSFIESAQRSCRVRGNKIANECFEGDMAVVMGEVFGEMLACRVINMVGNSLWDCAGKEILKALKESEPPSVPLQAPETPVEA